MTQSREPRPAAPLDKELEALGWYHDNLTRHAAEALLLSNGQDGSYLLRKSNEREDLYSLSVRGKDSVKHFLVEHTGTSFKFGFNEFSSLKELVMHFANQPLIGSETGTLIVLKHPYPREVEEPSIYESVRVHTAMQTGRTESDLVPNAPSLGTKEGYLIKQGKIVKATEPIRALDLTECSAVQFDYSQERVNCFCHRYGSNWSSVTPPSAPSCTSPASLRWQELPPGQGRASLTRGRFHISVTHGGHTCLCTRMGTLAYSSVHRGLVQLSALRPLSHVRRQPQNQCVGLVCMVCACNTLKHLLTSHRGSHC
ncbi:dual adapter for phosphotyrosine and 3-phosphotyrosine and 3-phosphoinositide isoform X2 [Neopsephotus bourkii]|uniref:dual adapter for phosphotyrosine and 3-phosphotyrosine and 3-phosphoinositide isoform X2 n=1 Tax=Neopsephotus bourkii TaxID=309878 RepID=UPI002AA58188|nr:dual adapter for phosphotyrosine and 3-phosphotyrosine and 3-phosphoinositide isoform X2 [Neopsephotus bourkii]